MTQYFLSTCWTPLKEYLRDKDYDEFKNNRMLQDAVIREIEIIGEATKNLSMAFRNKYTMETNSWDEG